MTVLTRFAAFTKRHPVIRGMLSYATIWPTSCIIQQTMAGKRWDNYDWAQVMRFSLYGGLYTAPTLYGWVRIASMIWPKTTLSSALTKALVEQATYGPFALVSFFFGMSLLEGKSVDDAKNQVHAKFLPTWQVGICFWPVVQTINFMYVKERNRVAVVSMCSLLWCCFLAYMHERNIKKEQVRQLMAASSS